MFLDQKSPGFSNTSLSKVKKLRRNRSHLRRLMVESLEDRRLLNVDWRNPVDSIDVDNDGSISPLDALVVINYINAHPEGEGESTWPVEFLGHFALEFNSKSRLFWPDAISTSIPLD